MVERKLLREYWCAKHRETGEWFLPAQAGCRTKDRKLRSKDTNRRLSLCVQTWAPVRVRVYAKPKAKPVLPELWVVTSGYAGKPFCNSFGEVYAFCVPMLFEHAQRALLEASRFARIVPYDPEVHK